MDWNCRGLRAVKTIAFSLWHTCTYVVLPILIRPYSCILGSTGTWYMVHARMLCTGSRERCGLVGGWGSPVSQQQVLY